MGTRIITNRHPLVLQFKGERDYIQGPDIFDATIALLQASATCLVCDIDIAFHRLAHRAVDLVCSEQGKEMNPVAVCQYLLEGERKCAYVVETDKAVEGRLPYLEYEIVDHLTIDVTQRSCWLEARLPFTDIEIWVAMTKALHQRAIAGLEGKWLFVRGRFAQYDSQAQGLRELSIKANFNNKLTRSEALRDGRKVGEIYFSIV